MNSHVSTIFSASMLAWAPPPRRTISQWADEFRYLSSESSPEAGKWHTDKAAYQRGIMDAISDINVEDVTVMSSAQVGKTEIINNVVGYYIDQEPSPMLVVQPTVRPMAEEWSKNRLSPMIRDTPTLRDKVQDVKSRNSSNTIFHKKFPGGNLNISGANSPASLAAMPRRIILLDEIDRYPASAGSEGDPVSLAVKRAANYWNRKIVKVSTPTVKGLSRIEKSFDETDQRRYFIPCPECGEFQTLRWANVKWMKDDEGNHLPDTAVILCEFCQHPIDDIQRWDAVRFGEWRATATSSSPRKVGFHIWAAYSPWTTMAEIVREFLAKHKDREQYKTFVNTVLGETWDDPGTSIDQEGLFSLREPYPKPCPDGVLVLTCGVDVQRSPGRLEGEVKGWGIGEECWGIENFIIYGNPEGEQVWRDLDMKLQTKYAHSSGLNLLISCTVIDSGYLQHKVHKFVKRKSNRRVYAGKGSSTPGKPIISRPSVNNEARVPVYMIGTDTAKERIFSRLQMTLELKDERLDGPNPGIMHWPTSYDKEYFDQLTAEKGVPTYYKGVLKTKWVKIRPRNEALDLTVYNFAAMEILKPNFAKIKESFVSKTKKATDGRGKARPVKQNTGWVNGWKKY